jgi:tetratricopeptide (TPR) repeat protein
LALATATALWLASAAVQADDLSDLTSLQAQALPATTAAAGLLPGVEVALARHPRSANRHWMVAMLQVRHSRESGDEASVAAAEANLRQALVLRPDYTAARVALAGALNRQHQFRAGAAAATAVLATEPGALAPLAALFDAQFGIGDYDAAASTLGTWGESRAPALLVRQAQLEELHGNDRAALRLLVEAARRARDAYQARPEVAWHLYRVGEFMRQRGDLAGAGEFLDAALRLDPGSLPALTAQAHLVLRREPVAALAFWEDLAGRMPHPEVLAQLGDLYVAAGRETDGAREHAAALRAGDLAGASEDRPMARLLADRGWRPQEALRRARRDLRHRHDVEAWDTFAWAAYRAGSLDEAAAASEQALRRGTRRADFHQHAAHIAAAQGNRAVAARHHRAAAAIDPHLVDR